MLFATRAIVWGAVAGSILLAACSGDSPLQPDLVPPGLPERVRVADLGTPFQCGAAIRIRGTDGLWRYNYRQVRFPDNEISREHKTIRYVYRGNEAGARHVVTVVCIIPNTKRAIARLDGYLKVDRSTQGSRSAPVARYDCVDGVCGLEGLTATGCTWGGVWPNCYSKPASLAQMQCGALDPYCSGGGTTGDPEGGWTGEGTGDSPNPPPPPCRTGDAALDAPPVQAAFGDLMTRSHPEAEMANRLEKGAWIIQTPAGYSAQLFPETWTLGPCGIEMPANTVPPAGAVAWVHTHPYAYGEELTSCDKTAVTIGGVTFLAPLTYTNDPSEPDGAVSSRFNLTGYILDKDKITRFEGDPASPSKFRITQRVDRCGY